MPLAYRLSTERTGFVRSSVLCQYRPDAGPGAPNVSEPVGHVPKPLTHSVSARAPSSAANNPPSYDDLFPVGGEERRLMAAVASGSSTVPRRIKYNTGGNDIRENNGRDVTRSSFYCAIPSPPRTQADGVNATQAPPRRSTVSAPVTAKNIPNNIPESSTAAERVVQSGKTPVCVSISTDTDTSTQRSQDPSVSRSLSSAGNGQSELVGKSGTVDKQNLDVSAESFYYDVTESPTEHDDDHSNSDHYEEIPDVRFPYVPCLCIIAEIIEHSCPLNKVYIACRFAH